MHLYNSEQQRNQLPAVDLEQRPPRARAIVEFIGVELSITPIADSDSDEKTVLDALRFVSAKRIGQ